MHLEFRLYWKIPIRFEWSQLPKLIIVVLYEITNNSMIYNWFIHINYHALGKIKYYIWKNKKIYNHKKALRIFGLLHMNRRIGVGAGWLIETIYPSYDYVGFIFHSPRKMSDYVYIKQLNLSRGNIIIKHRIQRQYEQHSKYNLKLLSFFRLWKKYQFRRTFFLRVFGCDARFRKVNQRCDR